MQKRQKKSEIEPQVGIFWVVDGAPVVAGTPISEVKECAGFKDYAGSHYEHWGRLQEQRLVPSYVEYEQHPRGRIVYNARTRRFALYADKCILADQKMVASIMKGLHLPAERTKTDTDLHYRCYRCLGRQTS
jgi:hypothetical protein